MVIGGITQCFLDFPCFLCSFNTWTVISVVCNISVNLTALSTGNLTQAARREKDALWLSELGISLLLRPLLFCKRQVSMGTTNLSPQEGFSKRDGTL